MSNAVRHQSSATDNPAGQELLDACQQMGGPEQYRISVDSAEKINALVGSTRRETGSATTESCSSADNTL
jgi:hypothetical protein